MSDVGVSAPSKTRRLRWAPKVRTGCITCRQRKKKCDEARPSCGQCVKGMLKCNRFDDTCNTVTVDSAMPPVLVQRPMATPGLLGSANVRDILYLTPTLAAHGFKPDRAGGKGAYDGYIASRGGEIMSFAGHLPSRCGREPVLDMATDCVAAMLREITSCVKNPLASRSLEIPVATMRTYCLALVDLQRALDDVKRSQSAEILCATQLLVLFECLRGENTQGAAKHMAGVTQLLRFRGTKQFTTDFEKSLLCSQLPLHCLCSLYQLKESFLAEREWIAMLGSCVSQESGDYFRKIFAIQFFQLLFQTSGPMARCATFFLRTSHAEQVKQRDTCLTDIKTGMATLDEGYTRLLAHKPPQADTSLGSHGYTRWHLYIHLADLVAMFLKRFYVGIGGSGLHADALTTELEVQKAAVSMLQALPRPPKTYSERSIVLVLEPGCRAILKTADEWIKVARCADASVLCGLLPPIVSPDICRKQLRLAGFQGC